MVKKTSPITLKKKQSVKFSAEALLSCKALASTPEAAEYLLSRAKQIIESSPDPKKYQSVLANLQNYAVNVRLERTRPNALQYRSLDEIKTDFETLQDNLAEMAADVLEQSMDANVPIVIGHAISDESEFRAFFSDGKALLPPKVQEALQTLFNACLAKNKMLSEDGIIYEASGKEIQKDNAGNPIKAKKEKIVGLIRELFQEFVNAYKKTDFTIQSQAFKFPSKTAEATAKPAPAETKAPAKAPTAAPATAPEVPAEEPSVGPGRDRGLGG